VNTRTRAARVRQLTARGLVLLVVSCLLVYAESSLALNGYGLWAHILPRAQTFGAGAFWNDVVHVSGNVSHSTTNSSRHYSILRIEDNIRVSHAQWQKGALPAISAEWLPPELQKRAKPIAHRPIERIEDLGLTFASATAELGSQNIATRSEVQWGFPMRANNFQISTTFRGRKNTANQQHGVFHIRCVPLPSHILPLGFAVNTLFTAAFIAIAWWAFTIARRRLRTRRGQCPACAYDLRSNHAAGCPECGWNARPAAP
jgi:hypothetical protein